MLSMAGEKSEAEADLAQAQPFVEEAERAVESIKGNDLNELKKLPKPSDIIKLIFDCVGILKVWNTHTHTFDPSVGYVTIRFLKFQEIFFSNNEHS